MQNYPPPIPPPPSLPVFRCICVCASRSIIVPIGRGEVKWIENHLPECFVFIPRVTPSRKAFQPQGSSVNRFAAVDRGSTGSIARCHQGLLTYWLVKILTLILSPSSFLTSCSLCYLLHYFVRGVRPAQHFWR